MSNAIQNRTVFNLRLNGANPGFVGAARFVLEALATSPDAVSDGLHIRLPGSMTDRLVALGVPAGIIPEFTGVLQHLGVFRHIGGGTGTTWFVVDPTFAAELLREPWVTRAFASQLERADLFAQIRRLKAQLAEGDPAEKSVTQSAPAVDSLEALKAFFVKAFEDFHDPSRGEGLYLGHEMKQRFREQFALDLEDAIAALDEVGFLRTDDRHPRLVWRGMNFPEAPPTHLRVVAG